MSNLSSKFFTQLFQRLNKKTPKFFNILTTVLVTLASLATGEEVLEKSMDTVPDWLPMVGYVLKVASALAGIATAQATIQTKSTPPLGDQSEEK